MCMNTYESSKQDEISGTFPALDVQGDEDNHACNEAQRHKPVTEIPIIYYSTM